MATPIEPLLTVTDLDLMPDDGNRYEIVQGALLVSRAPSIYHQVVVKRIISSLDDFVEPRSLGLVIPSPGVILSEDSGIIPDIVFISRERRADIASGEKVTGAPDLVIEIVSPGMENERRDREIKRQLYARHGVREYWLVYLDRRSIELYLHNGRELQLSGLYVEENELASTVLAGYRVKVQKLFVF